MEWPCTARPRPGTIIGVKAADGVMCFAVAIPTDLCMHVQQAGAAPSGPGPMADGPAARQSDTVPLPGGTHMPLIGFGTYKVDSVDAVK